VCPPKKRSSIAFAFRGSSSASKRSASSIATELAVASGRDIGYFIEVDALRRAAPVIRDAGPHLIHQNVPYHVGRYHEEVGPIPPIDMRGALGFRRLRGNEAPSADVYARDIQMIRNAATRPAVMAALLS
jgi:hypothetical protein